MTISQNINRFTLPGVVLQLAITIVLAINWHPVSLLVMSLPLAFDVLRYRNGRLLYRHEELYQPSIMNKEVNVVFFQAVFHGFAMSYFVLRLLWFMLMVIATSPLLHKAISRVLDSRLSASLGGFKNVPY